MGQCLERAASDSERKLECNFEFSPLSSSGLAETAIAFMATENGCVGSSGCREHFPADKFYVLQIGEENCGCILQTCRHGR